jgi:hypothetical protein
VPLTLSSCRAVRDSNRGLWPFFLPLFTNVLEGVFSEVCCYDLRRRTPILCPPGPPTPLCAPRPYSYSLLFYLELLISLKGYSNTSGLYWCAVGVV